MLALLLTMAINSRFEPTYYRSAFADCLTHFVGEQFATGEPAETVVKGAFGACHSEADGAEREIVILFVQHGHDPATAKRMAAEAMVRGRPKAEDALLAKIMQARAELRSR